MSRRQQAGIFAQEVDLPEACTGFSTYNPWSDWDTGPVGRDPEVREEPWVGVAGASFLAPSCSQSTSGFWSDRLWRNWEDQKLRSTRAFSERVWPLSLFFAALMELRPASGPLLRIQAGVGPGPGTCGVSSPELSVQRMHDLQTLPEWCSSAPSALKSLLKGEP